MNGRILQLRTALKLSQEAFGSKIGITRAAVSKLELGENLVTDTRVKLICATYNVNENWLRTGEGSMFIEMSVDDEFDSLVGELLADDASGLDVGFKKEFVSYLLKLDETQWESIKLFINTLAKK